MVAPVLVDWQEGKSLLGVHPVVDAGAAMGGCCHSRSATDLYPPGGLCGFGLAVADYRAGLADGRLEGQATVADGADRLGGADSDRIGGAGFARGRPDLKNTHLNS